MSRSHTGLVLDPAVPVVDANGDTTLRFILSGADIEAESAVDIVYEALVDGQFD